MLEMTLYPLADATLWDEYGIIWSLRINGGLMQSVKACAGKCSGGHFMHISVGVVS